MNRSILISILLFSLCCDHSTDPDTVSGDEMAFTAQVLNQVRAEYPDRDFQPSGEPLLLVSGDYKFGLQNLYAKCRAPDLKADDISAIITQHFQAIFEDIAKIDQKPNDWETAKEIVHPQFMPVEYLEKLDIPHKAFCDDVVIAFVLDRERQYQYVVAEDIQNWDVTLDVLEQTAIANLVGASKVHSFLSIEGKVEGLAVDTGDGYDAVRILLPHFREFLANELGEPFEAAIPNRDFLIMWSLDSDEEFRDTVRRTVKENFGQSPYPLTPSIFRVTSETIESVNPESQ